MASTAGLAAEYPRYREAVHAFPDQGQDEGREPGVLCQRLVKLSGRPVRLVISLTGLPAFAPNSAGSASPFRRARNLRDRACVLGTHVSVLSPTRPEH